MVLLAIIVAAGVLALWLVPSLRRGAAANLTRAALTGLLAAAGVFFILRGRFVIGAAFLIAAALAGAWRSARDILVPRAPLAAMSVDEALAVLGLAAGANAEEIRSAHRALIQKLHPDRGGTAYLAAKLNQARDVLLAQAEG